MDNKLLKFKKGDFAIIVVLVIASIAGLFLLSDKKNTPSSETNYAVVSIDGQVIQALDLGEYTSPTPEIIDLNQWGIDAKLELLEGKVRFIEVDCPDHLCENQGFISQDLQSAVCMPNRTAVFIYTPEDAQKYIVK